MPRLCLSHASSGRAFLAPRGLSGIYPSEIVDDGPEPSPLLNDADLPGDEDTLILWLLTGMPGVGTTHVTDAGRLSFIGAPDGLHAHPHRVLYRRADGSTGAHDSVAWTIVGKRLVLQAGAVAHTEAPDPGARTLLLASGGQLVARTAPQSGDRLLTLSGSSWQAAAPAP